MSLWLSTQQQMGRYQLVVQLLDQSQSVRNGPSQTHRGRTAGTRLWKVDQARHQTPQRQLVSLSPLELSTTAYLGRGNILMQYELPSNYLAAMLTRDSGVAIPLAGSSFLCL